MVANETHSLDELAIMEGIRQACQLCYADAYNAGWYTDLATGKHKEMNAGERIALMHSELSEMLESIRKPCESKKIPTFTGQEEEAADVLIRLFDYAGANQLRLAEAVIAKIRYNRHREDHKIENRKNAGKQF